MARYGTWSSPIGPDFARESLRLSSVWIEDGVTYWREARPGEGGRGVIVRRDPWSEPQDLTPAGFNVRTKVHEYGGGDYLVHRDTVFFSNFADQRLYRLAAGAHPVAITPETGGRHRFADGRVTRDGQLIVCVRERHEGGRVADVLNELVAIPVDGSSEPRIVAGGRDFYAAPRISPDGWRLAWLTWDLPWMPWDGCELRVADLGADGSLSNERLVAGRCGAESIWQPEWSPSGELHLASDRTGWWNLYRERDGELQPLRTAEAEFGWPMWALGGASYAFLSDGRIACLYGDRGVQHVALLDPETGELVDLDLPYTAIPAPSIAAQGSHIVFVGGAPTVPHQVVHLDFSSRSVDVLRESERLEVDPAYLSVPRPIEFPTEGGLTAHAHLYPPANRDFEAPAGELPPLIVMSHGGPTAESTAELDLEKQLFTSRGFALVDVNYGGSTGFGRAYRERLNGNWGVVDTADCVHAARFLVAEGLVDGNRLAIRGGSAGGYTALRAVTTYGDFSAGASYYGIADLEPFATGETHKFESRYEHTLVGPWPEAADVYRARSPIHAVDQISCPLILLQGAEDVIVPPAQAEVMVDALRAKGLPFACILFEGEQHGFRSADTIRRAAEAELYFYARIFAFELADPVEPVEIHNLSSVGAKPNPGSTTV